VESIPTPAGSLENAVRGCQLLMGTASGFLIANDTKAEPTLTDLFHAEKFTSQSSYQESASLYRGWDDGGKIVLGFLANEADFGARFSEQ
jgi:hypothetical protein